MKIALWSTCKFSACECDIDLNSAITASLCSTENGYVVFEAVEHRGWHVGILDNGQIKDPSETGVGNHAQFWVIVKEMVREAYYRCHCNVLCSSLILMLQVHLCLSSKPDQ